MADVEKKCPACETPLNQSDVFCPQCGRQVTGRVRRSYAPYDTPPIAQWARAPLLNLPSAVLLRLATGRIYTLRGQLVYVIGRRSTSGPIPDVDLGSIHADALGVSRAHVAIHMRPDGVYVEDLQSASDTVLIGYRLAAGQLYPLRHGDELKLGGIVMSVEFYYD